MAAVRRLGFLEIPMFNCWYGSEGQYASLSQISCRSVKSLQGYGHLSISQDGGRPPSGISFTRVWTNSEKYLVSVAVQNLVGVDAVASIIKKF